MTDDERAARLAELADLERELLVAADVWFSAALRRKLLRLIEITRVVLQKESAP